MNSAIKTILTTVIAAGIVGNVAVLWQLNTRITSMESTMKFLVQTATVNLANK